MTRPGFSLLETMIALVIAAVACGIVAVLLTAELRLTALRADRLARAEALRVAMVVLGGELRNDAAGDVRLGAGGALELRAFRGSALVCGAVGSETLVRYDGLRQPDPSKDSVLVAGSADGPIALEWTAPAAGGCGAGEGELLRWRLATQPRLGALLLLFERGSYVLQDSALRYGRGGAGRQPLMAPWLDDGGSTLRLLDATGADAGADPDDATVAAAVVAPRPRPGEPAPAPLRVRVPLSGAVPGGAP